MVAKNYGNILRIEGRVTLDYGGVGSCLMRACHLDCSSCVMMSLAWAAWPAPACSDPFREIGLIGPAPLFI
jgi:hypothetical protein